MDSINNEKKKGRGGGLGEEKDVRGMHWVYTKRDKKGRGGFVRGGGVAEVGVVVERRGGCGGFVRKRRGVRRGCGGERRR